MQHWLFILIETSLMMSLVALLLLALTKLLGKKFPARWRYAIWGIVLLGFLIPFRPDFGASLVEIEPQAIEQARTVYTQVVPEGAVAEGTLDENNGVFRERAQISFTIRPMYLIFAVWILGAAFTLAWQLYRHRRFTRLICRWRKTEMDQAARDLFQKTKLELGIPREIILYRCKAVTTPMLVGFRSPSVYLPQEDFDPSDLRLIFLHELTHYKCRDLWRKLLLVLVLSLHWFNPMVYYLSRIFGTDCEASCDEMVVQHFEPGHRIRYVEAILGVVRLQSMGTLLSTTFYGGKKDMKKRLLSIMDTTKKSTFIAFLCGTAILAATLMTGTAFAHTKYAGGSSVSMESAKQIALNRSGGGTVVHSREGYDDGHKEYEFTIINGNKKYEIDVRASDGAICEHDEEGIYSNNSSKASGNISLERAKEIALAKTGGGTVLKCKLDDDDGITVYDVEIINGSTKYEMEINASSGVIYQYEVKNYAGYNYNSSSSSSPNSPSSSAPSISPQISADKARQIALNSAGGGVVAKCKLDYEHGTLVYEVEIYNGGMEHEFEIDADTGNILKHEQDYDD